MKHPRSPLFVVAMLACASPFARAQVYERIDVSSQGEPANFGANIGGEMSHDGRFVVFQSDATNLGGPDVPGTRDIFVRDRQLGTTTRVTTSLVPGNPPYTGTRMSGDGSTIAFNQNFHAFVYVLATGTTTELIVPGLHNMLVEALSLDGRYASVTAQTIADPTWHIYRIELATKALVKCSRLAGAAGARNSDIDDDGTHVVFESTSPVLVPLDTNGVLDCFVFDVSKDSIECVSVGTNGNLGNLESLFPKITGDGRYVTMNSRATNWSIQDTSPNFDVYVRDRRFCTTTLMTLSNQGTTIPLGAFGAPSYASEDATSVAFTSLHPTGPADAPITLDVFLRDNQLGLLHPSSPGDTTNGTDSFVQGLTRDGRQVLVFSYSQALVNGIGPGYFVADFGPRCSTSGYCTSLPNSTGSAASISAQGDASRTLNDLVIAGVGMPDTAIALVVSASSAIDPGTPFANGLLCIGGGMIRHGIHVANGGVILDAQDLNAPAYEAVNPGDTRYYQIFYRDPLAGGAQFNTTDGVAVTFCW